MKTIDAKNALGKYPHHPKIQKYGYIMIWDDFLKRWVAAYEGEHSGVFYHWNGEEFVLIQGLGSPFQGSSFYYEEVCKLANETKGSSR